jgi:hypothetical protein
MKTKRVQHITLFILGNTRIFTNYAQNPPQALVQISRKLGSTGTSLVKAAARVSKHSN